MKNYKLNNLRKKAEALKHDDLKKEELKKINEYEKILKEIKSIKELYKKINITIKIKWYKHNVWGFCPTGYVFNSNNTKKNIRGICGCGYDKLSTATAKALNKDIYLMALIAYLKNKKENINKKEFLGYGLEDYFILPYFKGGVGIDSHILVLKILGFNVEHITTNTTNTIYIRN